MSGAIACSLSEAQMRCVLVPAISSFIQYAYVEENFNPCARIYHPRPSHGVARRLVSYAPQHHELNDRKLPPPPHLGVLVSTPGHYPPEQPPSGTCGLGCVGLYIGRLELSYLKQTPSSLSHTHGWRHSWLVGDLVLANPPR